MGKPIKVLQVMGIVESGVVVLIMEGAKQMKKVKVIIPTYNAGDDFIIICIPLYDTAAEQVEKTTGASSTSRYFH